LHLLLLLCILRCFAMSIGWVPMKPGNSLELEFGSAPSPSLVLSLMYPSNS
jgi:hypothetical protein